MRLIYKSLKRALFVLLLTMCLASVAQMGVRKSKPIPERCGGLSAIASDSDEFKVRKDSDGFLEGRNYKTGSAWVCLFIRVLPGQDQIYLNYLAGTWKKQQQALKDAGIILSFRILQSGQGNRNDYNVMMMTEYKDLASLEANQYKMDAIINSVQGGTDEATMAGYRDRDKVRTLLGGKISREIIFR
ncbi:MAG: hypothetical protein ACREAC_01290, partial [Blastocatellia bacterium]